MEVGVEVGVAEVVEVVEGDMDIVEATTLVVEVVDLVVEVLNEIVLEHIPFRIVKAY